MMKLLRFSLGHSYHHLSLHISTKMQAQLLCSPSSAAIAQYDVGPNCRLPSSSWSKNRLAFEKTGRFASVLDMGNNRKGPLLNTRVVLVTARGDSHSQRSMSEASASGFIAKDLETRIEDLQQQELLSSSIGTAPSPPGYSLKDLSFMEQHLLLLGFLACVMTGALSCVLLAAIPTLIAMKKAAESLGKLADTAREELPGTMAAVRLSGMEISDLTMELSDLGQEISAGVRSSSRAVRAAEDGLRRIGNVASIAVLQERMSGQVEVARPAVARAARSTREALIRARSLVHSLITLARLSSWMGQFWTLIPRPWQRKASPILLKHVEFAKR